MSSDARPQDDFLSELAALRDRVAELERDSTERMRTIAALRSSEARWRSLMENAPSYILTLARDATILTINRIPEGKTADEVIGRKVYEFMPPEAYEALVSGLADVFDQRSSTAFENSAPGPEGSTAWYDTRLSPVIDDGEVVSAMLVGTDITTRKRAEEALEESEVRFRELFSNMSSGVAVYRAVDDGRDFAFVDFNRAGERIENTRRVDVVGKRVTEAFPGVEEFGLLDVLRRVWCSGKPEHYPIGFYQDERVTGWRENFVYQLPSGEVVAVYDDVTERRRAEEALRRGEERFRAIAENLPGAVFSYDVDGDFQRMPVYVGPEFVDLIGQEAADRLKHGDVDHFFDLIHPEDREGMRNAGQFEPAFAGPVDQEYRVRTATDGYTWVRAIAQPIRLGETTLRWHGVLLDITEQKAAEEARVRLESQLRRAHKLQAVGQLAAGVAHDFNSLLAVVLGNAELVRNKLACASVSSVDEACAGPLSQIIHAVESGRSLVRKLLTFGRVRKWKPQPLDLNKVIDDMQAILESLAGSSIRLKVSSGLNLRRFGGDASQIEQVIMNLALNARDAMPEGGELRIETANADLGEQHAAANAHSLTGPHVMMAVSDTGTGIESEILDRVFEPFYTTKPVDKGSGLGLSIVYGIVEHAGGRIEVESGPGNGTTFRVYFPAQQ